jgi:nuclear receptor interaction protein
MPHSNDGTLVTCAADSTVRVFDIEYSRGKPGVDPSGWEASVRSRRFSEFFTGARYLSDGNTNTRVYRSHADRVKRIVTESSPYLFLTCSEDGEVRQWDLRLPSSAYPPPRGGQGFMSYRPGRQHDDSNVPPPLISYKQYNLDLNTISCSPSQPHYIALGGAHMHCFLHDRRMIGPDRSAARGSATPSAGSVADEEMSKATRCVRRFAPGGKHRVKHAADGHITACKISDANPDEIIVSWSGDHIYSFDLIRGPDAREGRSEKATLKGKNTRARRSSKSRKRKRQKPTTPSSQESGGPQHSRFRSEDLDTFSSDETGEEEHIDSYPPYDGPVPTTAESILEQARFAVLNDAQRLSMQIAKGLVKLRRNLFSLEATVQEALRTPGVTPASYADFFASTLEMAEDYLPTMEEVMRHWRYPLNPSQDTVNFQMSLRHNRESAWRFVQASGAISYALSNRPIDVESVFQSIQPAPGEEEIPPGSKFGYEFLRAILLWLQHGRARLLEGFQRRNAPRRSHDRYPIPDESEEDAIETILIPYLMDMARDTPVVNLDSSSQNNSARNLFPTQLAAVATFGRVVRLPLEDLGDPAARVERRRASNVRCLDRDCSKRFWVLRVGRSLLMEAAKGVNYMFVNHAFGGMRALPESSGSESDVEIEQADIEPNAEEEGNSNVNLVLDGRAPQQADAESESSRGEAKSSNDVANRGEGGSDDSQAEDDSSDDEEDDDDDVDEWPLGSSDDEDNAEYDSDDTTTSNYAIPRVRQRDVERHAPCSTHIRSYRGHCNIKTVKDVNFFGLNDEYVVSGSDSGHIFIWDRKTSHLVNILEGDSDIVNVVQGKHFPSH